MRERKDPFLRWDDLGRIMEAGLPCATSIGGRVPVVLRFQGEGADELIRCGSPWRLRIG